MTANLVSETAQIAATGTDKAATFSGAQQIYINCDGDCYIDFNQPAVTSRSQLLKANLAPTRYDFRGGSIMTVHAITSSGSVNVFITAVYN